MRKTKEAVEKLKKAELLQKEAEQVLADARQAMMDAEQVDIATMGEAKQKILDICEENNLFCGLILTKEDVLNIISLAIDSKENIKIPFVLYFIKD